MRTEKPGPGSRIVQLGLAILDFGLLDPNYSKLNRQSKNYDPESINRRIKTSPGINSKTIKTNRRT